MQASPAALRPLLARLRGRQETLNWNSDTVLVIGGSTGMGRAIALQCAAKGARVHILARRAEPLHEVVAAANAANSPHGITAHAVDATNLSAMQDKAAEMQAKNQFPHLIINTVGAAYPKLIADTTPEDFTAAMKVNLEAAYTPVLAFLPQMRANKRGHLAFTSSMMGYFGIIGYSAYAASKYALSGLAEVLRHELAPEGIEVTIAFPPDTDTPGFITENQEKPAATRVLSEGAGLLSADAAARSILAGIESGTYAIYPGTSRPVNLIARHFPGILRAVTDRQLRAFLRKTKPIEHHAHFRTSSQITADEHA